jgi:hypothetical protein
MERQNYFIVLFVMVFTFNIAEASYKSDVYKAYIDSDMSRWKKVIDEMDQKKDKSNDFRIELLNYQYGYIGWCIGNKKSEIAEKYIRLGELNLADLEESGYSPSCLNAYKSAFFGYRIGLNILKAPFFGPRSVDCAKLAMKQDDKNPYGYIQYANSQYYMPSAFGGSKSEALKYYLKAELLMENNRDQIKEDWNYLSLLSMIAQAYTELNDFIRAKVYYIKILTLEPNFLWVKNELYPQLLQKL